MYLVSVYFDEKTNKILNRWIHLIAEKTGNDFMTLSNVPPHMTLSSIEARSVDVLTEPIEMLCGKLNKGDVSFVSTGQLMPYVFFAMPVLNDYLQELSNRVYESVKNIPKTSVSRYYQPGSWLPHVTLGKTLTKEQMRTAFAIMQEQFQPFTATVTEIGLAKVNPHEDVVRFEL